MACNGGCINGGGTPRIGAKSQINENLCISCGTCIQNCPVNAIQYNVREGQRLKKKSVLAVNYVITSAELKLYR